MRVNKRAWKGRSPLKDLRSGSRRRRKWLHESGDFEGASQLYRMQDFAGCGSKTRIRQYKRARNQCRPRRVLATRHRARSHTAHLVPTIHRSRFPRSRRLLFVMMMFRNRTNAARATVHTIRQKRGPRQWCIKQRHRKQANPRCGQLNAILSFRTHEDSVPPHDTRIGRPSQFFGSRILLRMPAAATGPPPANSA